MKMKHILALIFIVLATLVGGRAFGGVYSPIVEYPERTVPVFEFNLVYFNPAATNFIIGSEIELQASTNSDFSTTNYWACTLGSGIPAFSGFANKDIGVGVYYSGLDDTRQFTRALLSSSHTLTDNLLAGIDGGRPVRDRVLVCPSNHNAAGQKFEWMREGSAIYWMYRVRGPTDTGPINPVTGRQQWTPCNPVEWRMDQIQSVNQVFN